MIEFLAAIGAPGIIAGIIALIGILLKNKAVAMIAMVLFLFFLVPSLDLPAYIWLIIIIIMAIWIIKWK